MVFQKKRGPKGANFEILAKTPPPQKTVNDSIVSDASMRAFEMTKKFQELSNSAQILPKTDVSDDR